MLYSCFNKGYRKKLTQQSRKVNLGYDQYTVPDSEAVEPTFVAFF